MPSNFFCMVQPGVDLGFSQGGCRNSHPCCRGSCIPALNLLPSKPPVQATVFQEPLGDFLKFPKHVSIPFSRLCPEAHPSPTLPFPSFFSLSLPSPPPLVTAAFSAVPEVGEASELLPSTQLGFPGNSSSSNGEGVGSPTLARPHQKQVQGTTGTTLGQPFWISVPPATAHRAVYPQRPDAEQGGGVQPNGEWGGAPPNVEWWQLPHVSSSHPPHLAGRWCIVALHPCLPTHTS